MLRNTKFLPELRIQQRNWVKSRFYGRKISGELMNNRPKTRAPEKEPSFKALKRLSQKKNSEQFCRFKLSFLVGFH